VTTDGRESSIRPRRKKQAEWVPAREKKNQTEKEGRPERRLRERERRCGEQKRVGRRRGSLGREHQNSRDQRPKPSERRPRSLA